MTILTISPSFWQFLQFFLVILTIFCNVDNYSQCWQILTNSVVWALNLGPNPTQKWCETFCNWHLFVSWILPSFCSWQSPPLWNLANFDHICPLPAGPNVTSLQKVISNTPYLWSHKKLASFSLSILRGTTSPPSYMTNSVRKKDFCLLRGPEGGGNPI